MPWNTHGALVLVRSAWRELLSILELSNADSSVRVGDNRSWPVQERRHGLRAGQAPIVGALSRWR